MLFGTLSGGLGAELAGGNFWQGAATAYIVSLFNHALHGGFAIKSVVAGIYGAGSDDLWGNSSLSEYVESKGGKMFRSSWPWGNGDDDIINYLKNGYDNGKKIEIYGYSRGGAAAIRIANKLGEMGIYISKLVTIDPQSMLSGGFWRNSYSFNLKFGNVMKLQNFYQQNQNFMFDLNNPFWGNAISSDVFYQNNMNTNLTGVRYKGSLLNHNNIVQYVLGGL